MKFIDNGICAPKGFKASGVHCGIRKNKSKKDLALIVCEVKGSAASVYTTNLVKGAPLLVTKSNLADGYAQAVICNSGNANTCNADGLEIANKMCELVEQYTGIKAADVIVASTGVIGQPLNIEPIASGMDALVKGLKDSTKDASDAIMTTDTINKIAAVSFELDGVEARIGGIAKGSGMIHPNMATMLAFLTTDVAITPEMLKEAIGEDVKDSFNMVSVDGDTSTNDMMSIIANGMAGNKIIADYGEAYDAFRNALNAVTTKLSKLIAKDGEGASRVIECKVCGADTIENARKVAKSIITSSLFKAAIFGADANWGRALCAVGYSGAAIDVTKIDMDFASVKGTVPVCRAGAGIPFSEETAKLVLLEKEIEVHIDLNSGEYCSTAWGCDLTYEYVRINGDYRT
jgi:glutamate N-acetyltransferase/amino-acid N-acetyltransferase